MNRRLLFLPGAGADPAFWRPLGDLLPATWEKIYFGWPGIGHQPPSPQVNGLSDLVTLVEASLGDSQVDLLAQSMGGAIALQVALRHPQRIRRIVLAVTSGGLKIADFGAADWRAAYRQEYPESASWIMEQNFDLEDQLPKIEQPTLLLWGANDPISPVGVGQRLLKLLPNAQLEIVPQGNHGFIHDRPLEVLPSILRHLE
ncbi:MAG: alpha/beta hydrolase [Caldilineaceae bacterium]